MTVKTLLSNPTLIVLFNLFFMVYLFLNAWTFQNNQGWGWTAFEFYIGMLCMRDVIHIMFFGET